MLKVYDTHILRGKGGAKAKPRGDADAVIAATHAPSVGQAPRVRFRCVSAEETPAAIDELCLLYRHTIDQQRVPALPVQTALVLDFLCIHPFRDGNGRVSRLLTLLCLYRHGHGVGRYVSLERPIEDSREEYYAALHRSCEGWHEGRHDLLPWLGYILSIVRRAYGEFEDRAGQVSSPRGSKAELVTHAVRRRAGEFTLSGLGRPDVRGRRSATETRPGSR